MKKKTKKIVSKVKKTPSKAKMSVKKISVKPVPARKMPVLALVKLSAKARAEFREMLLAKRQELVGQVSSLKGDSLTREDAVATEEDGTDAFERQLALTIASSERDTIFEIDEALRRIEFNTYGVCEQCSKLIEEQRLKAMPFVKMCIACKSEAEKGTIKYKPMNTPESE
jgi:DnaK suppressor protein